VKSLLFGLSIVASLGCHAVAGQQDATRAAAEVPAAKDVFDELNRLRADPASYIPVLETYRSRFKGKRVYIPGEVTLVTNEGPAAVDEAIEYLKKASPLPAYELSETMSRAAADHVSDLGPSGNTGHYGSDGSSPSTRLRRYGTWKESVGEALGFGEKTAQRMIMLLLIDDGVPDRGHRKKLFSAKFRVVGIACGPHKVYRQMCVLDFAGEFVDKMR
jgi:uncharacterized protein YkwD